MSVLKIELDDETYRCLVERAARERRPIDWQAEIELARALRIPTAIMPDGRTLADWDAERNRDNPDWDDPRLSAVRSA